MMYKTKYTCFGFWILLFGFESYGESLNDRNGVLSDNDRIVIEQRHDELLEKHHERTRDSRYPVLDEEAAIVPEARRNYELSSDPSSLALIRETMSVGSTSEMKLYLIKQLQLDANTVPIFTDIALNDSNERYRGMAILRLRELSSSRLSHLKLDEEVFKKIESYTDDPGQPESIRYAARITLEDLKKRSTKQSPIKSPEKNAENPTNYGLSGSQSDSMSPKNNVTVYDEQKEDLENNNCMLQAVKRSYPWIALFVAILVAYIILFIAKKRGQRTD